MKERKVNQYEIDEHLVSKYTRNAKPVHQYEIDENLVPKDNLKKREKKINYLDP